MKKCFMAALLPLALTAAEVKLESLPLEDNMYSIEATPKPETYLYMDQFTINPEELVVVGFKAKAVCGTGEYGKISAGFRQFTADGRRIRSVHVQYVKDSDAVLSVAAVKGSKTIRVNNPVWRLDEKSCVAVCGAATKKFSLANQLKWKALIVLFDAKPDHSDIPAFGINSTAGAVLGCTARADGSTEVELGRPLSRTYAAGTPMRLHLWGMDSEYTFSCWPLRGLKGYQFAMERGSWLPGARSARLCFIVSRRANFKPFQIKLERPTVKRTAVSGELF